MEAEKCGQRHENIDSEEHDLSSEELTAILEIRIDKGRARLSQNLLEKDENLQQEGVVGKTFFISYLKC